MCRAWLLLLACLPTFCLSPPVTGTDLHVPVLVYHRFGSVRADDMTVSTPVFEAQMTLVDAGGYHVVPLRALVDYLAGKGPLPPPKSIVLTADDGHRSIFTDMYPVIKRHGFAVTLFIYPSAISNASWAMTWAEIQELQASGLFDTQSHTYWHPNFRNEQKRLTQQQYRDFVKSQLCRSKTILEAKVRAHVELMAWPFGIYDDWLMGEAAQDGYVAGFTIERRPVSAAERIMALPRFLVTDADRGARFERLLSSK